MKLNKNIQFFLKKKTDPTLQTHKTRTLTYEIMIISYKANHKIIMKFNSQ
jgi:hypothetical protein